MCFLFVLRWLKPIFEIGWKRSIEEDDIYTVENDMQSELHTEAFAKGWELECKKKEPKLFRVMLKMYLYKVLSFGVLYAVVETLITYEPQILLTNLHSKFDSTFGEKKTIVNKTMLFSDCSNPFV